MRSVRDLTHFENVPVLVRTAMNVPIENGKVINDYRLRRGLDTIKFLAKKNARIILLSHIGEKGTETLKPVADALGKLIPRVSFFPESIGRRVREKIKDLVPGDILVLENLRRHRGEQMNDPEFAQEIAALGDVFVQDSFDTCHRQHASIVGVPKILPSYAGLLLEQEMQELNQARAPKHPALAVIGGAKFSTKEVILNQLLQTYDQLFVGGALGNDFLQARGYEVGKSLTSNADKVRIQKMLASVKLLLPIDALVIPADKLHTPNLRSQARLTPIDGIKSNESILDHGPATSALLASCAHKAKSILWNGPLGNYENGFIDATDAFARDVSMTRAHSIVGGGDTIASIESLGLLSKFSFVSTGGGAMLDFLAKGTLPGIEALENHASA